MNRELAGFDAPFLSLKEVNGIASCRRRVDTRLTEAM